MSSFFKNTTNTSATIPLKERSNSFLNQTKVNNFFGVANNKKPSFFVNKNSFEMGNKQKNSFFGGNSGNKKASNWFANTSTNPDEKPQNEKNESQ